MLRCVHVASMSDDLSKLPWLIRHSRRTLRIIHQNITMSLGVKVLFRRSDGLCDFAVLWVYPTVGCPVARWFDRVLAAFPGGAKRDQSKSLTPK